MTFWQKIKLVSSKIFTDYILPAIKTFLKDYGPILLQTAEKVCMQLLANQIPGVEKKEIAFTQIRNELIQQGFVVADREINKTIEIVLDKIKSE